MTEGLRYDIFHPDLVFVGSRDLQIGFASPDRPSVYDRVARVAIVHLVAIEDLPVPESVPPVEGAVRRERRAGNSYAVSADPARLDLAAVHAYLSQSYWSPGLPLGVLRRAVANSLCFGAYLGSEQVGFARVVTDRATFAYLCDVYVLDAHRGRGLATRLVTAVVAHPDLQGLRRFALVTRDAHGLYARFGFTPLARPEGFMEVLRPGAYPPDEPPAGDPA